MVRVRFAPSPTGFLHVGGARTALFNFLFARHEGGAFILRIEDTDKERSRPELTRSILDSFEWLGLKWDEGPVHQADAIERHRADAETLLRAGHAYRCFCSTDAIAERRAAAEKRGEPFAYDRRCRDISPDDSDRRAAAGERFALRFRVPEGTTSWDDLVHGPTAFENRHIEDFVLLRSDGSPTYNFAVVSDDRAMTITHVVRGDDHLSNTPKQILVYQALAAEPPAFGHVPLILGPDGKRLSKRHGATSVEAYREAGILPQAMVNFLALLGWSPGEDREIFELSELVERFSLEGINKKSAVFDPEKLEWLNGQHLTLTPAADLLPLVAPLLEAAGIARDAWEPRREWFLRLLELLKVRARNLRDIARQARAYFPGPVEYDAAAVKKHWSDAATAKRLAALEDAARRVEPFDEANLEVHLREVAEREGVTAAKYIHPLRVALTGQAVSPGVFEVAVLMGRDLVLARLAAARQALEPGAVSPRPEGV